jgi:hypothetical protein
MAEVQQMPINTSRFGSGLGVHVTVLSDFDDPNEDPRDLIRYVIRDPDDPNEGDIGTPNFQMTVTKSFYENAKFVGPSHVILLHGRKVGKIVAIPVFPSGDWATTDGWVQTYADVSAVPTNLGACAMASVPVLGPMLGPPDEYLTSILSVPSASDLLGITILPKVISGHTVAAAAEITGADLGFDQAEYENWRWTGFVARRNSTDPDLITVFAGLEKLDTVRKGPGDLSGSANYVFTVRESDSSLEIAPEEVEIDIPFTPHQLAEGSPFGVSGSRTSTVWCIGRVDPEYVNPSVVHNLPSATADNTMGLAGSVGIWASTDLEMFTWQRVYQSPIGISSPPVHHLNSLSADHSELPRDLGIMYSSKFQRLLPVVIDNDSGQDPVIETPRRAKYDFQGEP